MPNLILTMVAQKENRLQHGANGMSISPFALMGQSGFPGFHEILMADRLNTSADNNEMKLTRTGLACSEVEFPDGPLFAPELG